MKSEQKIKKGKVLFKIMLSTSLLIFNKTSFAGEFHINCFSNIDNCASKISNIVTNKFTQKFPATRFTIVVIAGFQPYSDGGGVGYGIAGVSLRGKSTQVPIHRYNVTRRITGRQLSGYEVTNEIETLIRSSVEQLMADCERSSNCDVYDAYE